MSEDQGQPWASPVAQMVKNLPARKTWVQSLGQEDPLEKGMATDSSNLAWKIPWTEEPGGLQSMGLQRVRHNLATNTLSQGQLWKKKKNAEAIARKIINNSMEKGVACYAGKSSGCAIRSHDSGLWICW